MAEYNERMRFIPVSQYKNIFQFIVDFPNLVVDELIWVIKEYDKKEHIWAINEGILFIAIKHTDFFLETLAPKLELKSKHYIALINDMINSPNVTKTDPSMREKAILRIIHKTGVCEPNPLGFIVIALQYKMFKLVDLYLNRYKKSRKNLPEKTKEQCLRRLSTCARLMADAHDWIRVREFMTLGGRLNPNTIDDYITKEIQNQYRKDSDYKWVLKKIGKMIDEYTRKTMANLTPDFVTIIKPETGK